MEPTLDLAIARLFGQSERAQAPPAATSTPTTGAAPAVAPSWEQLAADARQAYQRAIEAQRAGDWAKYGEEIKRLGELLERLKQQQ
jgi:uncharacterized protein